MAIKKTAFIIWAKNEAKLSLFLAKELDAKIIVVFNDELAKYKSLILLRYIFQGKETWKKLKEEKSQFVLVQNPPIVAVLVVYLYCLFNQANFSIDTHTAAILDFKWRILLPLHKLLAKKAAANTFHNYKNLEELEKWKLGNTRVINFYTPSKAEILDNEVAFPKELEDTLLKSSGKIKVFMVNRFANDDAFLEVIETAKIFPEAMFFITGNNKKLKSTDIPQNVSLTGFLDYPLFIKLMDNCDVVLSLTKRRDTVLWSAHEAVSLRKPVILSDTEVLRHYFSSFGIFSKNEPENLKEKIKEAFTKKDDLSIKAIEFEKVSNKLWQENIAWIKDIINKTD